MAEFPALEVIASGPHGPPLGTRLSLAQKAIVLGRAKGNDFQVPSSHCSRRHCEVVFEHERWWVRDLGSNLGTFVRGERVHDAQLLHGDCFELPWGICFRLLLHQSLEVRNPQTEQALMQQPDDEHLWAVYADWLLEHGNPLGERLLNPTAANNGRWLGTLARDAVSGDLEVTWANGLPSRVVMRRLSPWSPEVMHLDVRLRNLVRATEFQFIRSLELDVGSIARTREGWADGLLQVLAPEALPFLQRIALGPTSGIPETSLGAAGRAILEKRRKRYPHFITTPETVLRAWKPASLTFNGHLTSVPQVGRFPVSPSCELFFADDRWQVEEQSRDGLRVNGIFCQRALLRPGDVLEPIPGKQFHFSA